MKLAVLAAATALLTGLAPAFAAQGAACTLLSDDDADTMVSGGVTVPDAHLDLRAAAVQTSARGMTFRFRDTQLAEGRLGEWRLTFTSRGSRLFVGAGQGMWVNAGAYHGTFGFVAGTHGGKVTQVTGAFDYGASEIRIDVPYAAFGAAAPKQGDTVRALELNSKETFVNAGSTPMALVDHASAPAARIAGC